MALQSINPTNNEVIATYEEMSHETVDAVVAASHRAFLAWREVSFSERARLMRAAGAILREREESYAELMAKEMGKPIAGGRAEVEKCAWVCDYYAEKAESFLERETVKTEISKPST